MKKSEQTLGVIFLPFSKFWEKWNQKWPKSMIFRAIACLIWSGTRISGQKAILGPKNKVNWKSRSKLWVSNFNFFLQFSKFSKKWNQKSPKSMIFRPIACLIWSGTRISGQKAILGAKNKVNWKSRNKLWVSFFYNFQNSEKNEVKNCKNPCFGLLHA